MPSRKHREIIVQSKTGETFTVLYKAEDEDKIRAYNWRIYKSQYGAAMRKDNKSGFRGVSYYKEINKKPWIAQIKNNGKRLNLGFYSTKEAAAIAYDKKVCELRYVAHPERMLNFPERYEEYMADLKKKS